MPEQFVFKHETWKNAAVHRHERRSSPWAGIVDRVAEKQRLEKESEITKARAIQLDARLRDSAFLTKAPPHIIEKEKQKLDMLEDKLKRLHQELCQLAPPNERED